MGVRIIQLGTAGWEAPNRWSPFDVDGVTYGSLVHWIEADRAGAFGDDAALRRILEAASAEEAAEAGAQVAGFVAGRWDEEEALRWGLLHVCHGDEGAAAFLVRTGDDELVVTGDARWGIGDDADPEDPATWSGENLLGRSLMSARATLREDPPDAYRFGHDIITKPRHPAPVVGEERPTDEMSLKHMLFGFGGALGPRDFLIGQAFAGAIAFAVAAAVPDGMVALLGFLIGFGLYGWMVAALYGKRVHSTVLGGLLAVPHVALVVLYLANGRGDLFGWGAVVLVLLACLVPARWAESTD